MRQVYGKVQSKPSGSRKVEKGKNQASKGGSRLSSIGSQGSRQSERRLEEEKFASLSKI